MKLIQTLLLACCVLCSSFVWAAATPADAVNINAATAEQMAATLKGIGIKKAQLIVEYREQYGPFVHPDQLAEVKGIGLKTVKKNLARIRLSDMPLLN